MGTFIFWGGTLQKALKRGRLFSGVGQLQKPPWAGRLFSGVDLLRGSIQGAKRGGASSRAGWQSTREGSAKRPCKRRTKGGPLSRHTGGLPRRRLRTQKRSRPRFPAGEQPDRGSTGEAPSWGAGGEEATVP